MMAAEDSDMKNTSNVDIETYRKLVQTYISLHIYQAALFWADKVVALSCGNPRDVYWLAQCMFLMKQYHRGAHLLRIRNLDKTYILCNKLTVQCLLEANEYSEALRVLNSMNLDVFLQTSTYGGSKSEYGMFDDTPIPQVQSSVLLLKGKVLEAMDNRGLASDCYRQALQCDVYCYEAFESLVQHQMLSAEEEEELLHSLPISDQCTPDETEILLLLYRSKLKKYHTPKNLPDTSKLDPLKSTKTLLGFIPLPTDTPHHLLLGDISTTSIPKFTPTIAISTTEENKQTSSKKHHRTSNVSTQESVKVEESQAVEVLIERLHSSLDMIVSHAEHLYYNCEYQRCTTYTEHILKQDPYHSACLPIHISCQVELKNPNKLFTLAHNLVDLYPNLAISWFAVGCYYYIIPGKSDQARRYLAKATSLDRLFGPAWLAYGHSFAIENEHDQAMAAYFKASQLMKGCHLPLMYIGLECGLTNNVRLAEKFFNQANKIAPNDPFVLHEMGVIAHQNLDYNSAELYFNNALKIIRNQKDKLMPERWAPLLNNLAHTLRKQKKYEQALIYHHEALVLLPQTASTYSSIAYIYALMNKCEEAVDWFHKALGLRRDDTFSTTMLNYVIEQLSEDQRPYPDAPDFIPDFNIHMKSEKEAEQTGSSETLEQTSTSCMTPGVPESANSNATVNMSISMDMDMSEVGTPK